MLDDEGVDVNRSDGDLYTALHRVVEHFSAEKNHLAILRILVARGANVNADLPATDGWTPLHIAAWSGSVEAVEFLLNAGANPTLTDWYGQTPYKVRQPPF